MNYPNGTPQELLQAPTYPRQVPPPAQVPRQVPVPPQAPAWQQAPPQPWQQSPQRNTGPYPIAPAGKKFPVWIPIVAGALIVVIVGMYFFISGLRPKNVDYYELEGEKIPSLTKVLGEKKLVRTGTETYTKGKKLIYTYETEEGQARDVWEYLEYLVDREDFILVADGDRDAGTAEDLQVAKNAQDEEHVFIVEADYDRAGYTITASYSEGSVTVIGEPDPEPEPEPDPDPAPAEDPAFVKELRSNVYGFDCDVDIETTGLYGSGTGCYTRNVEPFAYAWDEAQYIFRDGLAYICDRNAKTFYTVKSGMPAIAILFETMQRAGSGNDTLNGRQLPYIDYTGGGLTARCFIESGDVIAMRYDITSGGQVYTVTLTITENHHTSIGDMFDTSSYTEVDPPAE